MHFRSREEGKEGVRGNEKHLCMGLQRTGRKRGKREQRFCRCFYRRDISNKKLEQQINLRKQRKRKVLGKIWGEKNQKEG